MLLPIHKHRSILVEVAFILLMLPCFVPIPFTSFTANASLQQVHIITRHGSRRPLPKSSSTLDDTSESSLLTPLGQKQHYELGQWLRERYFANFTDVLVEYDPNDVLVESTAYERTIVSANSLVLGLFPRESRGLQLFNETADLIPVYTRARNNDLNLRAYDKCDSLHDNLETLYLSDLWKTMEMQNVALLQRLAQHPAFAKYVVQPTDDHLSSSAYIPLTELWNVYDAIHVVETECGIVAPDGNSTAIQKVCSELPDPTLLTSINESDRNSTKSLAQAVELLRFSPSVAGNKVGGSLLNLILQRMESKVNQTNNSNATTSTEAPRSLFVTSAHYPTLLGLLTALETTFSDRNIPEYASALIFELYQQEDESEFYIKIFFKSGDSNDTVPIVVSPICRTDLDKGCMLGQFIQETQSNRLSAEAWCQVCINSDVDVCSQYKLRQLSTMNVQNNENYLYVIAVFGGILFSAIIFVIWNLYRSRTRRALSETNEQLRVNTSNGNVESGETSVVAHDEANEVRMAIPV
jgi:Histidine phosphatase superfamily (branch 2)